MKPSVYSNLSFEEMIVFRKDAFRIMETYNLTGRTIDLSFVEANEELAIQVFLYGIEFSKYCHDKEIGIDDDDFDLIRRAYDALQEEVPSDELSFIAKHYEETLSIYHCGLLFMNTLYDREEHKHQNSKPLSPELVQVFRYMNDAHDRFVETEEKMFQRMIHIFIKDETVLGYLDSHQQESNLLVRKGRTWWNNGEHLDVDDPFTEDKEIRNEYFREVMMDGMMQNNVIIEDNKEIGFLLFKLGVIIADYMNK